MGISAGGGRGGPNSDINVTPLVDVVLVLLIIFIVTIPVQMQHIDIEVPETAQEQVESTIAPITVTGMFDGSVRLDDGAVQTMVTRGALAASLRKLLDAQGLKKVVFVDFENELPWDQVVSILDTVKGVGKGFEQGVRIAIRTRDPSVAAPNSP